ncbi:hypothetical protein [Caballeronia sp. M23-90]
MAGRYVPFTGHGSLTRLLNKIRSDGRTISLLERDVELVMKIVRPHDGVRVRQGDRRGDDAGRGKLSKVDRRFFCGTK